MRGLSCEADRDLICARRQEIEQIQQKLTAFAYAARGVLVSRVRQLLEVHSFPLATARLLSESTVSENSTVD